MVIGGPVMTPWPEHDERVEIYDRTGDDLTAATITRHDGTFHVTLDPGTYLIVTRPDDDKGSLTRRVKVKRGQYAKVRLTLQVR